MNSSDTNSDAFHHGWLKKLTDKFGRFPENKEQLISLLRDARQRTLLDTDALTMIEGVLQVSELRARGHHDTPRQYGDAGS